MKLFAQCISWVFHPVIFSLLTPFIIVYWHTTDVFYSLKWTGFSLFFLLLALGIFFLMRPKEFFTDFDIYKREKRVAFYFVACGIAFVYFLVSVYFKGLFFPLSGVALGIVIGLVLLEIINAYVKASIHVAIVCSFVLTLGILYGWIPFLLTIWIPPLVGFSRLTLRKHTPKEVTVGAFFGIFVTLATYLVGKLLL